MRPPRNWLRKVALLGFVGSMALVLAAILSFQSHPTTDVTVTLLGYTNLGGSKLALFRGTNGSSRPISYHADIKTNFEGQVGRPVLFLVHKAGPIAPGQTFNFTLNAPNDVSDWQVAFFYELMWSKWQMIGYSCGDFLHTIGLNEIADSMDPGRSEGLIWLNCERAPEYWVNHYGFGD